MERVIDFHFYALVGTVHINAMTLMRCHTTLKTFLVWKVNHYFLCVAWSLLGLLLFLIDVYKGGGYLSTRGCTDLTENVFPCLTRSFICVALSCRSLYTHASAHTLFHFHSLFRWAVFLFWLESDTKEEARHMQMIPSRTESKQKPHASWPIFPLWLWREPLG